jgi:single-strand DNA-binding protein
VLNKIILIGRLTRDCDLSYTQSGIARCRFTLAVDRGFKNQQGEKQVDFIDITCWRKLAETASKYLQKGLLCAMVGSLQIRSYETKDGQKRKAAEVVADEVRFLEWPKEQRQEKGDDLDLEQEWESAETDEDLPF